MSVSPDGSAGLSFDLCQVREVLHLLVSFSKAVLSTRTFCEDGNVVYLSNMWPLISEHLNDG